MGIRLVVVDDNPHVRWQGRVHPINATFHRFLAGLLDVPGSPVAAITHVVPLADAASAPVTLPLDPRIRVVGTATFDGIAGYLRSLPTMLRANRGPIRRALAEADLLWLKVPASNAPLAAALALRAGLPRFTWVAGSAREVARARFRGPEGVAAVLIGAAYDAAGWTAGIGGDRIVVGAGVVGADGEPGAGLVTSLVTADEIREPAMLGRPAGDGPLHLVWAGRLAEGKGLEWLLDEIAASTREVRLDLIGDGPARAALEGRAADRGLAGRITWHGYIAERGPYLDVLAAADAFVFPSDAEGFPKVLLDAWAVGLPVLANPAVRSLGGLEGVAFAALTAGRPGALAAALAMLDVSGSWAGLAAGGSRLVRAHTRDAELGRLVARWRRRWPGLPWP